MKTETALTVPGCKQVSVQHDATRAVLLAGVSARKREWALEVDAVLAAFEEEPNRDLVKAEYAARIGQSHQTLYRHYYAWKERGLAGLLPKAKPEVKASGLPVEFVEWFRGEAENHNTDSIPQARRSMMQRLRRGEKIPGLGTWQALYAVRFPGVPPPQGVGREYPGDNIEAIMPSGYSARNLLRCKSELVESTAARQGTFAASKYGPFVFTTRVGLKVGSVYFADDVWHNQNVNWMGGTKAMRPIELCFIDALSAHKFAWGARPRLWNPETQKHEIIKEHEFRFLLAYALCEAAGYRPDGTILWLERGTAAVDETMEKILGSLSHGAITVKRAPLKDARQVCSIYRSVASGNPRFKAPLESHHNLAHTVLSGVVGQIGRNRDVCPEEIVGRDKTNELMLKIAAVLPPELGGLLELPYLQWDEYMECVAAAYDAMAWRTWHKLEGWEACKHFRREFCLPTSSERIPLDAITDIQPDACEAMQTLLTAHPEYCRIRPMAPIEVWERNKNELRLLPKCAVPLILGPKNGVVRKCPQEAQLTFASRELGPVAHLYGRDYQDESGRERRLQAGTEYLFHINPFSPARELFVSQPDGAYLGCVPRISVPCRIDQDAAMERIKQTRREWNAMAKRVSGRHLTQLAQQASAMARNTALVGAAVGDGMLRAAPAAAAVQEADTAPGQDTHGEDADAAILELYGTAANG